MATSQKPIAQAAGVSSKDVETVSESIFYARKPAEVDELILDLFPRSENTEIEQMWKIARKMSGSGWKVKSEGCERIPLAFDPLFKLRIKVLVTSGDVGTSSIQKEIASHCGCGSVEFVSFSKTI